MIFRPAIVLAFALVLPACADMLIIGTLEEDLVVPESAAFAAMVDALKEGGYEGGRNVRYQRRNAEARSQPLGQLAAELIDREHPALVLVFSPEALSAAVKAGGGAPIAFALQGEGGAQAAREAMAARGGLYGTAAPSSGERAVSFAKAVLPQPSLGVLVDPASIDSGRAAAHARAAGEREGVKVSVLLVAGGMRLREAAQALISQDVKALFITPSSTLEGGLSEVLAAANAAGIPVIAANPALATQGALAGFRLDGDALGREAGKLAAAALRGQATNPTLLVSDEFLKPVIDRAVAGRLGVPPDRLPPEPAVAKS